MLNVQLSSAALQVERKPHVLSVCGDGGEWMVQAVTVQEFADSGAPRLPGHTGNCAEVWAAQLVILIDCS